MYKRLILLLIISMSFISGVCQNVGDKKNLTKETNEWLNRLKNAGKEGRPYYSQFDEYRARNTGELKSSYQAKTGVTLQVNGHDLYYASGTWFTKKSVVTSRANLISIVKAAWKEYGALPCFSWHLENPYVPTGYEQSMGCRYRYSVDGYPEEHRYVIKEILEGTGSVCGMGNRSGTDNAVTYRNPSEWFDARCREVAEIIKEFVTDDGKPIPIILRLWHECEDSWQWWGKQSVSAEDFKSFFRLTVDKIEQYTQTHNIIFAYCPDRYWSTEDGFMRRYPGDDYVDMIGFDDYSIGSTEQALEKTVSRAKIVSRIANERDKAAALFETANSKDTNSECFFCDFLAKILQTEGVNLGLIQIWSTSKLSTEGQINDRVTFLKSGLVRTYDNK